MPRERARASVVLGCVQIEKDAFVTGANFFKNSFPISGVPQATETVRPLQR
jgi:hypothetical protein